MEPDYLEILTYWTSHDYQESSNQEDRDGRSTNTPIHHANNQNSEYNILQDNNLQQVNNRQTYLSERNIQEEGEGGSRNSPILHANNQNREYNILQDNNLQQVNNRQISLSEGNIQEEQEGGSRNTP